MNGLRYSDYVPPMARQDVRLLRGLPSSWEQSVGESSVEGLEKRANAMALALARRGRRRDADDLRRRVSLLQRTDELHRHASDVETIAGLYRALELFAHQCDPAVASSLTWTQAGALAADTAPLPHGPAFRETAVLRNRAFRWVVAGLARCLREL